MEYAFTKRYCITLSKETEQKAKELVMQKIAKNRSELINLAIIELYTKANFKLNNEHNQTS